jgi:micrococcal nuclease
LKLGDQSKLTIMPTIYPKILFLLLASLAACTPTSDQLTGKVIGVSDGDTIKILVNKKQVTVRLEGIDAPEAKQSFGTKSKQALSDMIFGREVTITDTSDDRYGRTLGTVMLGSTNINAKMIEDGWAWHYEKYNKDKRMAELEKEAKAAKRGLWADSNPLPPWEFRARKKKENSEPSTQFWLNTSSNVRHNENCEHFKKSKKGRMCGPDEGKACGICGG